MRSFLVRILVCASALTLVAARGVLAQGCGALQFAPEALAPCLTGQNQVEVADLNGDHVPDLVVTTNTSLLIFLGSPGQAGVPTYQLAASYGTPQGAAGIAIADFNSDGIPDIAVAIESGALLVYRGLGTDGVGSGTFEQYLNIFTLSVFRVRAADMNGDGILDLVATGEWGALLIYRGTGAGGHGDGGFEFYRNLGGGSGRGFVIADLDDDGILDIAVAANTPWIEVHKGLGTPGHNSGDFLPPVNIPTGFDASGLSWEIASGDLNHDGHTDLVVSSNGGYYFSTIYGAGGLNFTARVFNLPGTAASSVGVGDLNGDGVPDIVLPHTHGDDATMLSAFFNTFDTAVPADGIPAFQELSYGGFNEGRGVTLADVNLDGALDVLVPGLTSTSLRVILSHCGSTIFRVWTPVVGPGAVERSPDLPSYPAGSTVQLTAVPEPGNHFDFWSGDVVSLLNPLRIDRAQSTTVVAHFAPGPPVTGVDGAALVLALAPVRPNPSRGMANVSCTLPRAGRVRLEVLDAAGRSIRELADGELTAGPHEFTWDGRRGSGARAPAGLYWISFAADGRSMTRRFALLR